MLIFDGKEEKYDVWEIRFLSYLHSLKLKETVLNEPTSQEAADIAADAKKNEDCYAELVRHIDDKSLSLIRHDAPDDGRKALKILKEHYSGRSKPRIIHLYATLSRLRMGDAETVTDYLIRAEDAISALKDAGETLSEGLCIAMILEGLPSYFKPLAVHVTQNEDNVTFMDFKKRLRNYEEAEKRSTAEDTDNVMKTATRQGRRPNKTPAHSRREGASVNITCYRCGKGGHRAKGCTVKVWCNICKRDNHAEVACRRKDDAKRVDDEDTEDSEDYAFKLTCHSRQRASHNVKMKGIMIDGGATSHILNDKKKFIDFDDTFKPSSHSVELADGSRCTGMAQQRGTALISLQDSTGRQHRVKLKDALYMPTYPQDIFSVARATKVGATVTFKKGESYMITQDENRFKIHEEGNLYYLPTVCENVDKINACHDLQTWHEILGHCNHEDVLKLQNVVKGMEIKGNTAGVKETCEICIKGKFVQTRNRKPDARAKKPLELVHTDLAGPMQPTSLEGFRYAQSFTDDYSGTMMVYFLKSKSDTIEATERFLADTRPYGEIKCLRSDNGGEFASKEFKSLMTKNKIRHETSAPYSAHQNGTAERGWRTLGEMTRCLLMESGLPKYLWNYAMQTAAYTRNRCYSRRTKKTPYEMFTEKVPNVARLQKFGSECFAYSTQEKGKLDSRCTKGIFVGYDKNSPAYLVYYPETEKVQRHRLVKFTNHQPKERGTQTESDTECENVLMPVELPDVKTTENDVKDHTDNDAISNENVVDVQGTEQRDSETVGRRYPQRHRKKPGHLQEFEMEDPEERVNICIDSCYRAVCDIPQSYREAITSPKSTQWKKAMQEEMTSLEENDTYTLTELPPGKRAVGGKWVYALKTDIDGSEKCKARYVAKGYSQKQGTDYEETFSPTADMSSIRVIMQKSAQENLQLYQMDVKTAYLNAPVDFELYIEQPEGFEKKSENGTLVCKLQKSLYGLKQSGRNWNALLHACLTENGFEQNPADHCVYSKENQNGKVLLLIWVDDLILAGSNETILTDVKKMLAERFKMKDLGKLKYFLGIDFSQIQGQVTMSQTRYVNKILERFGMQDCKARETPCEAKLEYSEDSEKLTNPREYREAVGSLLYLSTCTRPDLSFVVSNLSRHFAEPTEEHWKTVRHVFRYLKGRVGQGLTFKQDNTNNLGLRVFTDADWASDASDRRSTTGYCISLSKGNGLISWKTRKQQTVALSTCEAEYMSLAAAMQECLYLEQLLGNLDKSKYTTTVIFEDNQGTIAIAKNPVHRQRCKHIDIKYHFIREVVNSGRLLLEYCPTEEMVADLMTKPGTKTKLRKFSQDLFGS